MTRKIDPATLIPVEELPALRAEAAAQAEVNLARMNAKQLNTGRLGKDAIEIVRGPGTQRVRYNKLVKLVDKASVEIMPFTACRKGCSYCCSIAVMVTGMEAKRIGEVIKRKPAKVEGVREPGDLEALQEKYFDVPCTFLKAGRCSIYEHRPLACRLHFNMADDPLFCSTKIAPQNSLVPALNLQGVDKALFLLTLGEPLADIRDFFPK